MVLGYLTVYYSTYAIVVVLQCLFVATRLKKMLIGHSDHPDSYQQSGIRDMLAKNFLDTRMEGQSACWMIKLNPSNYAIWKRKMQDLIIVKYTYYGEANAREDE